MASTIVWNALENVDPSTQLANALSSFSDAQFWEESISPQQIRQSLNDADPSSINSTPILLKGMKWLLANISKGRDVSDFYASVVKLVACNNIEVRKMVYIYLIQYANHSNTTRELSLLSINSFQRGLNDTEPLIRALALRVLTSVSIPDILQIQMLAISKHGKNDTSPYVRKCAVTATSKLLHYADTTQKDILIELIKYILDYDTTTMVLSSAICAYYEHTNARIEYLHILHGSYRKLCHLLTDMDEWGQVICMYVLTRYCRVYFQKPTITGTAEEIDATRRVQRRIIPESGRITTESPNIIITTTSSSTNNNNFNNNNNNLSIAEQAAASGVTLPPKQQQSHRRIIKRRVVKKGFYSDEEDESTEEEVYADTLVSGQQQQQRTTTFNNNNNITGGGSGGGTGMSNPLTSTNTEDSCLDDDHRLLLHSALPLLKSRNAGVVLAVCSLQYYCGVASIETRKAMGKALVRMHRHEYCEIPYAVLSAIRTLVQYCPSAFAPFLHDFYIHTTHDPHETKLIKLDVLTSLALDPPSIHSVLKELRTYVLQNNYNDNVNDDNIQFVCQSIQAVGKVCEMARICYDRHGKGNEADIIILNCLYGLITLSVTASHEIVIGESIIAMQRIIQILQNETVHDPNNIRDRAVRRILLLLFNTLSCVGDDDAEESEHNNNDDDDDDDDDESANGLDEVAVVLPPRATASSIWLMGQILSSSTTSSCQYIRLDRPKIRLELLRLIARGFLYMEPCEKEQGIHFASKIMLADDSTVSSVALSEHVLSMGRLDVHPDVRDRARFESGLIHATIGLKYDLDNMDAANTLKSSMNQKMTKADAQKILHGSKPAPSYLPLQDLDSTGDGSGESSFRFGTLSSLVGHRARSAYLPLPPWAESNSPESLRSPPEETKDVPTSTAAAASGYGQGSGFYDSDDDGSSSSSSSSSESSQSTGNEVSSSSSSGGTSSSSSSGTESSDDEEVTNGKREGVLLPGTQAFTAQPYVGNTMQPQRTIQATTVASSSSSDDDSSSSCSSASDSSGSSGSPAQNKPAAIGSESLIPMGFGSADGRSGNKRTPTPNTAADIAADMKGLVLAPIATEPAESTDSNFERDSGSWVQLVRPEHSRGLSARVRYLRGVTKAQQAQTIGLIPEKPTVVCLQIEFENQKDASGGPFRNIRVLQRSSSGSAISPKKSVLPQQIYQLGVGEKTEAIMGFDFASVSDRDGSLQAKLEIKFGSGGVPVEIKPTIGDLLLPCKRSVTEFDECVNRMHGFNRVESPFTVSGNLRDELPTRLLSMVALSPVGKSAFDKGDKLRLVGTLPASSDPVFVQVHCTSKGPGKLVVCCDHALVVNSIMNLLKRAVVQDEL